MAQHFITVFYRIPPELFHALIQCATGSLALQERYSLVSACTFLVCPTRTPTSSYPLTCQQASLINRTAAAEDLGEAKDVLAQTHGRNIMRALLVGFAVVAPRSATPNLVEVLQTLLSKFPVQSKTWVTEILYAVSYLWHRSVGDGG